MNNNNINNNVIIQIDESNKSNKEKELKDNSKNEIRISNLNNNINNFYLEENNKNKRIPKNNIYSNYEESKNNDMNEIEDGSFKFNKNSFFFNNTNNVLLVNIDNNSDYDETEIKRIKLKKNYYSKYTTNIIKINMENAKYDIINKKLDNDNICLTDKNIFDKIKNVEITDKNDDSGAPNQYKDKEKEKEELKIHYKIIPNKKNINNQSKPINALEKTSFEGSLDEIISNHLIKIHKSNNEINKQRIDKAYNNFQLRKSENLNNNIHNISENGENDSNKEKKQKITKSKSLKELLIKNGDKLNNE